MAIGPVSLFDSAKPNQSTDCEDLSFNNFIAAVSSSEANSNLQNSGSTRKDFTCRKLMKSTAITSKVSARQIILYRRVSTKSQVKDGYPHQLQCIKSEYPKFTIAGSTIDSISEAMSGCADAEVRMASGLGKCLRLLKRHPYAILLVSNADRIARHGDIFVLIQKQGLGQRVYDASTGMCLDDIVHAGLHHRIEKQTEANRVSLKEGQKRFLAAGGVLGSPDIALHSRQAALTKKRLADEREASVLSVVSRLTRQSRGKRPSMNTISDELVRLEIHTGQRRLFTRERISQLGKKNPHKWRYAYDSYARPRRRVRQLVTAIQIELRNRRDRKTAMRRLFKIMPLHQIRICIGFDASMCISHAPCWQVHRSNMCSCRDGCRGPPQHLSHNRL